MDELPFKLWRVNWIVVSIGFTKGDRWLAKGESIRMAKHLPDVKLQAGNWVRVGDGQLKDETLSDLH